MMLDLQREIKMQDIRVAIINIWMVLETKAKNRPASKCQHIEKKIRYFCLLASSLPGIQCLYVPTLTSSSVDLSFYLICPNIYPKVCYFNCVSVSYLESQTPSTFSIAALTILLVPYYVLLTSLLLFSDGITSFYQWNDPRLLPCLTFLIQSIIQSY